MRILTIILSLFFLMNFCYSFSYSEKFVINHDKFNFKSDQFSDRIKHFYTNGNFIYNNKFDNPKKFFFFVDINQLSNFPSFNNFYLNYNLKNFEESYHFNNISNSFGSFYFNQGNIYKIRFELNTFYKIKNSIYIDFNTSFDLNKDDFKINSKNLNSKFRVYIKF